MQLISNLILLIVVLITVAIAAYMFTFNPTKSQAATTTETPKATLPATSKPTSIKLSQFYQDLQITLANTNENKTLQNVLVTLPLKAEYPTFALFINAINSGLSAGKISYIIDANGFATYTFSDSSGADLCIAKLTTFDAVVPSANQSVGYYLGFGKKEMVQYPLPTQYYTYTFPSMILTKILIALPLSQTSKTRTTTSVIPAATYYQISDFADALKNSLKSDLSDIIYSLDNNPLNFTYKPTSDNYILYEMYISNSQFAASVGVATKSGSVLNTADLGGNTYAFKLPSTFSVNKKKILTQSTLKSLAPLPFYP